MLRRGLRANAASAVACNAPVMSTSVRPDELPKSWFTSTTPYALHSSSKRSLSRGPYNNPKDQVSADSHRGWRGAATQAPPNAAKHWLPASLGAPNNAALTRHDDRHIRCCGRCSCTPIVPKTATQWPGPIATDIDFSSGRNDKGRPELLPGPTSDGRQNPDPWME